MNKDLPVWVNVVRWALNIVSRVGSWCNDKSMALLDKHCVCELCGGRHEDR